jgi:predicted ABC-type ATPase
VPSLYVIAGPNGAGKTTFVRDFLRFDFAVLDFLNADEIARGLSPLAPERAQLEAGRIMLERVRRFIGEGRDFGMETTLSGRTYRNIFQLARDRGYSIHLDFLILPSIEHSIRRVADRVEAGGHNVPEPDLRRRFRVGLQNLFSLYRPVLDSWALYDNSERRPRKIAQGDAQNHFIFTPAEFEKVATEFSLNL